MLTWILVLLAVAAIAGFLGMGRVQGAALTGVKILVVVALVLFVLVLLGVIGLVDAA